MFVNSLFNDFLLENGLRVSDDSTRDIIGLEFNQGTRSYEEEISHLHKQMRKANYEIASAKIRCDKFLLEQAITKMKNLNRALYNARLNRYKYEKISKEDLRTRIYNDGIDITYRSYKRDGTLANSKTIHYVMLFRSTGKAKKGSCMFIRQELYKKAINFLRMGIKMPKRNAPIVEMSAYSPLIASGIVGRVKINPRNILILKDVDKYFTTNIISIDVDSDKVCHANKIENYSLKNTLFDGQALIDSKLFPTWGSGYILLRHHFCKMAAFSANIQDFFKDYFGDNYDNAKVTDMFGVEHYAKDIELITTDNAMKWLKSDVTYDYWCEWVEQNNCNFGIVKTAHPSKLGEYQKMSYQMVNSLDIDTMDEVLANSIEYVEQLKCDNEVFLKYLQKNINFSNDYEVLIALCKHNCDFVNSSYFRERKKSIIEGYVLNLKSGKVLQNADNLTIVGSPYAMLLHSVGADVDNDITFTTEIGSIQCYAERFEDGEYLAGFRSPFNGRYNMSYLHNVKHKLISKYFNFGNNVIAVNLNGTDFQDRNNGSDQDSDFMYVTNQPHIVRHAAYCYNNYPTIVNNIPKEKNTYNNTLDDFALLDNKLSASQTDIGESSNLAQLAQTYSYSFDDVDMVNDYVAILSVLAQVAIDSSKRLFDVDVTKEIKRMKRDMEVKTNGLPKFWKIIKPETRTCNINNNLICPMDKLANIQITRFRSSSSTIPMSEFFVKHDFEEGNTNRRKSKKVEDLIKKYALDITEYYKQAREDNQNDKEQYLILRSDFDNLINDIKQTYISKNYLGLMSWMINRIFMIGSGVRGKSVMTENAIKQNRPIMLKALYELNPSAFLACFRAKIGTTI